MSLLRPGVIKQHKPNQTLHPYRFVQMGTVALVFWLLWLGPTKQNSNVFHDLGVRVIVFLLHGGHHVQTGHPSRPVSSHYILLPRGISRNAHFFGANVMWGLWSLQHKNLSTSVDHPSFWLEIVVWSRRERSVFCAAFGAVLSFSFSCHRILQYNLWNLFHINIVETICTSMWCSRLYFFIAAWLIWVALAGELGQSGQHKKYIASIHRDSIS